MKKYFTALTIISFLALLLLPKTLPMLKVGTFSFGWGIGDIILIFTFIIAILFSEIIIKGKLKLANGVNSLDKIVFLFYVCLVFPVIISIVKLPGQTIFIMASYIKYLEGFIIYYLLRRLINNSMQAKLFLRIFIVGIIGVLVIAIIQKMFPEFYLAIWQTIALQSRSLGKEFIKSVSWRLAGPFFNANTLASFLLISSPILWAKLSLHKKIRQRLFYLTLSVLSIFILILTQSRTSYLGLFLVILFSLYFSKFPFKIKKTQLIIIIIIIVSACIFFPLLYHRVIEYTFPGELKPNPLTYSSISLRVQLWKVGINAFKNHWLIGAGFDQGQTAIFEQLSKDPSAVLPVQYILPHNTYIRMILEGGILIFLVFIYLLIKICCLCRVKLSRTWKEYRNALLAGFCGLVATGFFADTFQDVKIMISFMYLLAIINSLTFFKNENSLSS